MAFQVHRECSSRHKKKLREAIIIIIIIMNNNNNNNTNLYTGIDTSTCNAVINVCPD